MTESPALAVVPHPLEDWRVVLCEACGSEGRIYRGQYDDERDCGPCEVCEGTGGEMVPVFPVSEEDTHIPDEERCNEP